MGTRFHRHGDYGHSHEGGDQPHAHVAGDARSDSSELAVEPEVGVSPGGWHRPPGPEVAANMTSTKPGTPWFPDDGRSIGGGKQAAGLLFKSAARSGSAGITGPDPNVMWREAYYRKMAEDPSLPSDLRRGYENLLAEARKAAQESMVPASASSSRSVHIVRDRATGKVTKKTVEADVRKSPPPPAAKPQAAGGWGGFGGLSPRSGRQ